MKSDEDKGYLDSLRWIDGCAGSEKCFEKGNEEVEEVIVC